MKNASTDFSSSAARIATTTTSWSRLKGFEGNLSASKLNETIHRGRRDTPPSKEIFVERSSFVTNVTTLIKFVAGKTDYSSCINVFLSFEKKKKKISRYLGL